MRFATCKISCELLLLLLAAEFTRMCVSKSLWNSIFQPQRKFKSTFSEIPRITTAKPKRAEKFFDFDNDPEAMSKLRIALISIAEKFCGIFLTAIAWKLFFTSIGPNLKAFAQFIEESTKNSEFSRPQSIDEEMNHFLKPNTSMNPYENSLLSHVELPTEIDEDWGQLGGLHTIKDAIEREFFISTQYANNSREEDTEGEYNIANQERQQGSWWSEDIFRSRHSALLFGPPGNGKTALIRGICRRLQCPLLEITPSLVQDSYFGNSVKKISALFMLLRKMKRCAVFIDELDSLFTARNSMDQQIDRNIKTQCMMLFHQTFIHCFVAKI